MSTPLAMAFDEHRSTMSTIRGSTAADSSLEPASPPFPPRTPDTASSTLSGSISLGLRCFCGNSLPSKRKSGMFCSMDCARNGTFSSLTTQQRLLPSASTSTHLSEPFVLKDQSRVPSANSDYVDESSPHPRAMARADQRREERRRRRADPLDLGTHSPMISRSSTCPDMPTAIVPPAASPTFVPDLVSSHSRNTSSASSVFSLASANTLSRNGSICSSHHRQPSSLAVGAAIMEVDGEDSAEMALARSTLKARARRRNQTGTGFRRSATGSTLSASSSSDLRVHDMLDELIQMEQSFRVHDASQYEVDPADEFRVAPPQRVTTPVFTPLQHPPRTPSPVNSGSVMVPPAPGAPDRRNSLSDSRPSSTFAHQSSLSESHTALYLATASPLQSSTNERNRRSASPQLNARRSLVFTPSQAGPILPPSPRRFDSPSRRKPLSTSLSHPVMNSWRFPKTEFDANMDGHDDDFDDMPEPTMLWPADSGSGHSSGISVSSGFSNSSGFSHSSSGFSYGSSAFSSTSGLSQSAFPTSRASMNLAELATTRTMVPPRSGLRLNMLLSSSSDDDADVDMESEVSDDRSTVRGSVLRQSFASSTPSFAAHRGW